MPPLFILPGITVKLGGLSGCSVWWGGCDDDMPRTYESAQWLRYFAPRVPPTIKRPLLLIVDGCSSRCSVKVLCEAQMCGIIFVLLLANATYLL